MNELQKFFTNNKEIEVFNFLFPITEEYLFKYSKIVLNFIFSSQKIHTVNYYFIKYLLKEKSCRLELKYFNTNRNDLIINSHNFYEDGCYGIVGTIMTMMPIILSELIKNKPSFKIITPDKNICKTDFFKINKKTVELSKILDSCSCIENTFVYNCLSGFDSIEKLSLCEKYLFETDLQVLFDNLSKLKNLRSIKLQDLNFKNFDVSVFLSPPNIKSLFFDRILMNSNLEKFASALKSRNLEKLKLKNLVYKENTNFDYLFQNTFCSSLRKVIIDIETPECLKSLALNLDLCPLLTTLQVVCKGNWIEYSQLMKFFVDILCDDKRSLNMLKVKDYCWNFNELVKEKNKLDFSSYKLSPIDIVILSEIMSKPCFSHIKILNLSNSLKITQETLPCLTKVLKNPNLTEVSLKNIGTPSLEPLLLKNFLLEIENKISITLDSFLSEEQLIEIKEALIQNSFILSITFFGKINAFRKSLKKIFSYTPKYSPKGYLIKNNF